MPEKGNSHSHEPLIRSPLRALVQDFSPMWFTICMNSGIIGILLHQLPYQFRGLPVLSTIAFVIDLALFIIFSLIFITRLAWFGRDAYYECTNDVNELAMGVCWPISWLTLSALTGLIVSNADWGGYAFTLVSYVMWWVGAGWLVGYLLFVFLTLIRRHNTFDSRLPPSIIVPAVGVATTALTGGLITIYAHEMSARLAVPIIIVSFMLVGIGLIMAIFLYTYLLHSLLSEGWLPPAQIASLWLLVGPMGQCAAALQMLGSSAETYGRFAGYNKGTFLTAQAAAPLNVACVLLALLLTGMGSIWALIALYAMIEVAFKRQLVWNMTWNSIIFPTATLAISFLLLSIEMDSPAFRTVTTAMVILLVLAFFIILFFMLWKVSKGELLLVRKNPRVRHDD